MALGRKLVELAKSKPKQKNLNLFGDAKYSKDRLRIGLPLELPKAKNINAHEYLGKLSSS